MVLQQERYAGFQVAAVLHDGHRALPVLESQRAKLPYQVLGLRVHQRLYAVHHGWY